MTNMLNKKAISLSTIFFAFLLIAIYANAEEWVRFDGKTETGEKLELTGILTIPKGSGPFPAVVMLSGCGGLKDKNDAKQQKAWAERLMNWGYVSLQVDSFGPRGYGNVCLSGFEISDLMRSHDAYSAKSYLAKLDNVDPHNIAVIGWSHGGWAVLAIVDGVYRDKDAKPFQAAIAFYPPCQFLAKFDTPLLIMIGEKDNCFFASRCEKLRSEIVKDSKYEFKLKVYPNTHHAFDFEGLKMDAYGFHSEYNPLATADAIRQTKAFLAKYLRTGK